MRRFLSFMAFFGIVVFTKAQDPHALGIEQMKLWYNPALKTDTLPVTHVMLHNVNYPGILSTKSKSITLELVFERNIETVSNTFPFFTLTAGLNVDNASDNLMKASSAMLALSYALPLDYNNTYMAIGFQGNYSFNRVGYTGSYYSFPADFDRSGAMSWAIKRDPLQSGYNFGYFTFNAGASVFHTTEEQQWFVGFSTRYINHPYTEWDHITTLPTTFGVQAGYTGAINESTQISGYGNFSLVSGSSSSPEQYIGIRGIRKINVNDSSAFHLSAGLGVSFHQAVQPNLQLQWGRHLFAGYFDFNLPPIASSGYHRRSYALLYRYDL
ncbi:MULTISPECIES: hypothetical protein [Niastella]|uniref:Uncharacterized protein n=1 Tax=Niastella soli TaxID=2821487 RepID=A0ABS3YY02_9BACT|nr:hypothetical protein [Niastella soli]MBO9202031.1 hypothetical protein [Niastella soli]